MRTTKHGGFCRGLHACLVAAVCLTLSMGGAGCTLMDDWGHKSRSSLVGKTLSALDAPQQLAIHHGKLLVANGGDVNPGIAVVDTTTDTILAFYASKPVQPWRFSVHQDSLLFVESGSGHPPFTVNLASGTILQAAGHDLATNIGSRLVLSTGGRLYLLDRQGGLIQGIAGDSAVFSAVTGQNMQMTGMAVVNGTIFVARANSRHLLILDANASDGGARDSINIGALAQDSAYAIKMGGLVSRDGMVFLQVSKTYFFQGNPHELDTSVVLVLNASTRALETIIPLEFKHTVQVDRFRAPHVVDNVWYVPGDNRFGWGNSGVEGIDLGTRSGSAVFVATTEGIALDFVRLRAGRGYAIFHPPFFADRVERVSF
jgi:hypothetical protein